MKTVIWKKSLKTLVYPKGLPKHSCPKYSVVKFFKTVILSGKYKKFKKTKQPSELFLANSGIVVR